MENEKGDTKIVVDINEKNGEESKAPDKPTEQAQQKEQNIGFLGRNEQTMLNLIEMGKNHRKCGKNFKEKDNIFGFFDSKRNLFWVNFFGTSDDDDEDDTLISESTKEGRNRFVRIVLSIVAGMLLGTALLVFPVYYVDVLKHIFRSFGFIFMIGGFIGHMIISYAIMCSECSRRKPCNVICLILEVIFMSMIVAVCVVKYQVMEILIAIFATIGVLLLCIGLACTRFDFTKWYLYIIMISAALTLASIAYAIYMLIVGPVPWIRFIIILVATVLNILALTAELQMIFGGKTIELGETEYTVGAYMLYTSIVQIFMNILKLLRGPDD